MELRNSSQAGKGVQKMRKLDLLILICAFLGAFLAGCSEQPEFHKNFFGVYETREDFLTAIESGDADWRDFLEAVRGGSIKFKDVSAEAMANYLEAFANEGMLAQTPPEYLSNREMKTSLEVVFESHENIEINWEVYHGYLNV
jgi:hypothetical protein